jgi:hypothetical protein
LAVFLHLPSSARFRGLRHPKRSVPAQASGITGAETISVVRMKEHDA